MAKTNKAAKHTVTIKGIEYKLGSPEYSDENLAVIESLINMQDDETNFFDLFKQFTKDFRRMLTEAIEDGEGDKKVAEDAVKNLRMSFSPDGELMQAFQTLMQSIMS